jgi:glycosyltransferase involved in cell wall biosynthesis
MGTDPLVSVVIPAFNVADYIGDAVRSALGQTHPAIEVIVVDDGSTDGTVAALELFGAEIVTVRQANRGPAVARNDGFARCRGEHVVFLDGDDVLERDHVARLLRRLQEEPSAGWVYCGWKYLDENGRVLHERVPAEQTGCLVSDLLLRRVSLPTPGVVLLRRACVERVGGFDPSLERSAEDADFLLRVAAAGFGATACAAPLLGYRQRAGSVTARMSARMVRSRLQLLDRFFGRADLTPDVRALRDRAYATCHLECAFAFAREGDGDEVTRHLREAARQAPDLVSDRALLCHWIGGAALTPHGGDPVQAIRVLVDSAPPELAVLRRLRRAAVGSYHAAYVFEVGRSAGGTTVAHHAAAAAWRRPDLLANRGFWSIVATALWSGRQQRSRGAAG